jgi:hypothetical protein
VVGGAFRVLRRDFDPDVGGTYGVAGDSDARAAVDVDAVGAVAPAVVGPVGGIAGGDDRLD